MIMDRDQLDWFYKIILNFDNFTFIFMKKYIEEQNNFSFHYIAFVSFFHNFYLSQIFRENILLLKNRKPLHFSFERQSKSKSSVKMQSLKSICIMKIHQITARSLRLEEHGIEEWREHLENLPQSLKHNLLQDAIEHMIIRLRIMNFRHLLFQNPIDRYIAVIETITNFERRPSVIMFF